MNVEVQLSQLFHVRRCRDNISFFFSLLHDSILSLERKFLCDSVWGRSNDVRIQLKGAGDQSTRSKILCMG